MGRWWLADYEQILHTKSPFVLEAILPSESSKCPIDVGNKAEQRVKHSVYDLAAHLIC